MTVTRHLFVTGRVLNVPPDPNAPPPPPSINIGTLQLDGGIACPEQIPLFLPLNGSVSLTAMATVRYKRSIDSIWTTGHPLYRIYPGTQAPNDVPTWGPTTIEQGFAWSILDLTPGTSYDVEVTVTEGASTAVQTLTTATRSLPPVAGAPNKTANSAATIASQIAALNPGDVLEIADGVYDFTSTIGVNRSGNAANPIYIRGHSRNGCIIRRTELGDHDLFFLGAKYVILENFTVQGPGVDQGNGTLSKAFHATKTDYSFTTIRNITANGFDCFVDTIGRVGEVRDPPSYSGGILVYNNTATGNNLWTAPFYYTTATWNDHGIQIPGRGNCAFNNTMTGFGDTFSFSAESGGTGAECDGNSIFYYRNEIRNNCDDLFEADYSRRNCAFYDNRVHNTVNADSCAPIYKGPIIIARNIVVNILRARVHKWNNTQAGQFLYNNTYIYGPVNDDNSGAFGDMNGWYQPDNGPQLSYGFRNNIHVYRGASTYDGRMLRLDDGGTGHNVNVDWDHNSWYPNRPWRQHYDVLGGSDFASLAAAQSAFHDVKPIFSGNTRPFVQDNITVANPFTTTYVPPSPDARTEYAGEFLPVLSGGDVAKNSGVVIPNITDGYTGTSPDRGAVISGRALVSYGDPSTETNVATQLQIAADSILTTDTYLAFKGTKSGQVTGSLDFRQTHLISGMQCDPTEDGNPQTTFHTEINWTSKGTYDPVRKRVQWMSSGANGAVSGGYIYNTLPIYDEATDSWSVQRSFRGTNTTTTQGSIVHNYDGNCFHPVHRKLYKKVFDPQSFLQYDLDNDVIGIQQAYTSNKNEAFNVEGAMDYIASRGRLWVKGVRSADDKPACWEFNTDTNNSLTATTMIYGEGQLGNTLGSSVMSYNPRAFSGAGGVFLGCPEGWVSQTPVGTLTVATHLQSTSASMPASLASNRGRFSWPNQGHLCRDPVGDGWIYFCLDGFTYRLRDVGSGVYQWETRSQIPLDLRNQRAAGFFDFIVVPIDEYGVIWVIGSQGVVSGQTARAWLYKP